MIEWKRLYAKPAGSLPGGVVTQWGVGAITVFILLFLTYWIFFEGGKPAEVAVTTVATTPPRSFTQQMTARVDAETMRAETNKAAEVRAAAQALRDERAEQQRQAQQAGITAANQAAILAGPSPDSGQPYTAARMGTSGTLAPRSRRAAQPFASQFAGRSELPQTGQRRRRRRARANCRQPRTPKR